MKYSRISGYFCLFGILAILSLGAMARADAATYTYAVNGSGLSGFITTTCDSCALNASNITEWSLSAPGGITVSSTSPGAQLTIPAGDTDLNATPNGITFSLEGPFGRLTFSNAAASVIFSDDENDNIGFGPGVGILQRVTTPGIARFSAEDTVSTRSPR